MWSTLWTNLDIVSAITPLNDWKQNGHQLLLTSIRQRQTGCSSSLVSAQESHRIIMMIIQKPFPSRCGMLHDTVGICYQNLTPDTADACVNQAPDGRRAKRKGSFLQKDTVLEAYIKKPMIKTFHDQVKEIPSPINKTKFEFRDILWMINVALGQTTPIWTGWNSLITDESLPCQRVLNMENITLLPTRLDVIMETMKISESVASECEEAYMVVHYDLALAKPAPQIQATEAPCFDNLSIALGPFHICLASEQLATS